MLKNVYEKPKIDVQKFDVEDVITESSADTTYVLTSKPNDGNYGSEID